MKLGIVYDIDVKILEELEKKCFPNSAYTINQLEEIISDKEKYQILAVSDKNIIKGYIILFDNSESLEIMKIGTLVEYRRQGIGKILIDEISKMKRNIFLEVRENIRAREFYKSCGFEEVGKRKIYYHDIK